MFLQSHHLIPGYQLYLRCSHPPVTMLTTGCNCRLKVYPKETEGIFNSTSMVKLLIFCLYSKYEDGLEVLQPLSLKVLVRSMSEEL